MKDGEKRTKREHEHARKIDGRGDRKRVSERG